MFRNKVFAASLAAGLLLVILLGVGSITTSGAERPPLDKVFLEAGPRNGCRVRIPDARVVSSDPQGFEVESDGVRVRVTPSSAVAPGDRVALVGRLDDRGPVLRLEELERLPAGWLDPYGGAFSVALLVLVGINFLRHFAGRPSVLQVEGVRE